MSNPEPNIDDVAVHFCALLTSGWAKPRLDEEQAFDKWLAADLVDNPDPMALFDAYHPKFGQPTRTFRYGMPPFQPSSGPPRPSLTFSVSRNHSSSYRTPKEQAKEVVAHRSHVCWGAHMSNKARHVLPVLDGKPIYDGKELKRRLGKLFPEFKALWQASLRACGLRDAHGGEDWYESPTFSDELHVELPDAKISQSDPRAIECVDEYVRLVKAGASRDNQMEHAMHHDLKEHMDSLLAH